MATATYLSSKLQVTWKAVGSLRIEEVAYTNLQSNAFSDVQAIMAATTIVLPFQVVLSMLAQEACSAAEDVIVVFVVVECLCFSTMKATLELAGRSMQYPFQLVQFCLEHFRELVVFALLIATDKMLDEATVFEVVNGHSE